MTFTISDIMLTSGIAFLLGWLTCLLFNLDKVIIEIEEDYDR